VEYAVLVAVARDEDGWLHFLMQKRPKTGLLAGMWEFPGVEVGEPYGAPPVAAYGERVAALADAFGLSLAPSASGSEPGGKEMNSVTHVFSHLKARYHPFLFETSLLSVLAQVPDGLNWVRVDRLGKVPIPVAQQKISLGALDELNS
jgi:A/G-specific adenine glycosylase